MRRLSANLIYTNNSNPLKNGIVEINQNGKIHNIIDTGGDLRESRNLEFYNGIITPGFINTHCHLELSNFKNRISQYIGLPAFLGEVVSNRKNEELEDPIKAIDSYDAQMKQQGIVAVGDISNTNLSIRTKTKSTIYYHTFIEIIGLGENSKDVLENGIAIQKEFLENRLVASITPHSPYSVSKNLFKLIKNLAEEQNSILSIHNQESEAEKEMFVNKSGKLVQVFEKLGIDLNNWNATGKNSIQSIYDLLPSKSNILFVHNTFSTREDIDLIQANFNNAYWCLCPKSNLYIENKLPNLDLFSQYIDKVTIGTDSLASNNTLSVLEEMKEITNHFPDIEFDKLIKWSTINGAKALKIDEQYGSIDVGKTPGLNLITNFDFNKKQITRNSQVKVLI